MYQGNIIKKQKCCLICFKSLNEDCSFSSILSLNSTICNSCLKKFKVINKTLYISTIETKIIYEYNTFLKTLLYQYKGCYDIELKDVFFYQFKKELKKQYKGYCIIYPPSYYQDDIDRGFIHIKEMVKCLSLPVLDLFVKKEKYKQSDHKYKDRKNIKDVIFLNDSKIQNIKYLIVDDIFTSGSTLRRIIELLVSNGVDKQNIKALILCKTADFVEL